MGEYVNGTMTEIVNRYMISIIEDEEIKQVFEIAIKTGEKQKKQLVSFIEKDGFPIPIGFRSPTSIKVQRDCFQTYSA